MIKWAVALLFFLANHIAYGQATGVSITVASTTSTEQSGLFKYLLPRFTQYSGITVKVIALGTGQALDLARRGDADVVLVHDAEAEAKFVQQGFGVGRQTVMSNAFVLVGPKHDPAGVRGANIGAAFAALRSSGATFVSRADKSGTHAAELRFWQLAHFEPALVKPAWYKETGSGMGQALNTAAGLNAYLLADQATWASFKNRQQLEVLVQSDPRLFNPYGVILVNPARHKHVNAAAGQAFIDWLVSTEGRKAIAGYQIGGEQLFFPVSK